MNPFHDLTPGDKVPEEITVVIEVPKGSSVKYEIDKDSGMLTVDRFLYSSMFYPGDYGFIPRTYCGDNDPLDVLILSNFPVAPLTIVKARPIGILRMDDSGEQDDKVIAVHATDPRFNGMKDIKDAPAHVILEIRHFLETYKQLQNKKVKILKTEDVKAAHQAILEGIELYKKKFGKRK